MSPIACLSNGGASIFRGAGTDRLIVGTVDGLFVLEREERSWREAGRALEGSSVSAVAQLPSGTLIAATHGLGVACSTDGGASWDWSNKGLPQFDLWSARGGVIGGESVALVGSMPAHLMISRDDGVTWAELPALREVESFHTGSSRRRRAWATSRISSSIATACSSASKWARCWCPTIAAARSATSRSIPILSSATCTAC